MNRVGQQPEPAADARFDTVCAWSIEIEVEALAVCRAPRRPIAKHLDIGRARQPEPEDRGPGAALPTHRDRPAVVAFRP